jgi:plastocyanin
MRKLTIAPLFAIVALLAVPALGGTAGAATINLGDNFFSPSSKSINPGTRVNFNWTGNRRHNVFKKSGPGGSFISTTTKRDGVNFSKRFKRSGVYKLICTVHPREMKLRLTVG